MFKTFFKKLKLLALVFNVFYLRDFSKIIFRIVVSNIMSTKILEFHLSGKLLM